MQTLPPVGRIQGVSLTGGPAFQDSVVTVEYSTHNREGYGDHELKIPFLDAMYLLNILRDLEKTTGFDKLNPPPSR
jgi:hypothetical protein